MASFRLVPPQACSASTNCSRRSTSPVNSALPLMLSLNWTTSAVSTSSSLRTKLMAASCRKRMLRAMLPLASSTSTTESGIFSAPASAEASRKYVTSCGTPSSSSSMSSVPGRFTKWPPLSCTTAVTETISTSTSRTSVGGVGCGVGGCATRVVGSARAPRSAAEKSFTERERGAPRARASGASGRRRMR